MRDLSIIIVSFNTAKLTLQCLESIYANKSRLDFDVWLVDNASSDGTVQKVKSRFPQVKIIESDNNLGFAGGNNLALKKIQGKSKYYLLLNTDTIIHQGFIETIYDVADKNNFGITSCKLLNGVNKPQPNTGSLPNLFTIFVWLSGVDDILRSLIRVSSYQERNSGFYKGTKEVGWVSGSVMLISIEVLSRVGLMDEKIFMYGEDVEYCLRTRRNGFKIGWTDLCTVTHLGGKSSENANYSQWLGEFKGLIYIYNKHYGKIMSWWIRVLIRKFIWLRIMAFFIIGKKEASKAYAKIIKNI
jgi:GT2 family glycosyltransferase